MPGPFSLPWAPPVSLPFLKHYKSPVLYEIDLSHRDGTKEIATQMKMGTDEGPLSILSQESSHLRTATQIRKSSDQGLQDATSFASQKNFVLLFRGCGHDGIIWPDLVTINPVVVHSPKTKVLCKNKNTYGTPSCVHLACEGHKADGLEFLLQAQQHGAINMCCGKTGGEQDGAINMFGGGGGGLVCSACVTEYHIVHH
jgi:hypothetical protein